MDEVELSEQFDVVCYWDGFGVGTDQDQRHLLQSMRLSLNPCAATPQLKLVAV
jgi:hypothetical protein